MFTITFWKAALERAIGTFAVSVVGLAIVDDPFNLPGLPWDRIFLSAAIIAGLTVLKTLGAFATNGTPGFGSAEGLTPPKHALTDK